jgi:hypothetical protein
LKTEEEILEALNFDLYIENYIMDVVGSYKLADLERDEFYCISEILMLRNSDVFWKTTVLTSLVKMVRFLPLDNSGELKNDLIELTKSKEG